MKMRSVCSQIFRTSFALKPALVLAAILLMILSSGCGKRFEANSDGYVTAPPATSDPLTAEDQRRWDAANENKLEVEPVLESDLEVESFVGDLTGQAPAHTDDELAEEAERLHEQRRRSRGATNPDQPTPTKNPRRGRGTEQTAPTAPTAPTTRPSSPSEPLPGPSGPPSGPSSSTSQTTKPSTSSAGPRVQAPVNERETRPARPVSTIGSKFCESLNVTGNGNTDLSHLYNNPATGNIVMPSKELAAASSPEKKNRFVCLLLPAAIRMDEEVYRMRIEVLRLQAKQRKTGQLEDDEKKWLEKMAIDYRISKANSKSETNFQELLKRVDIIPLPLLLAQAAVESGWGTSNATKDLNNIFGIHAVGNEPYKIGYDTKNARVRAFVSIDAAISAYIQLLNTGTAYGKFRESRAGMRSQRQALDNVELMKTLDRYSERRQQYINNVIEIMTKSNKLTQFVFKEDEVALVEP
jgi:Bax protein